MDALLSAESLSEESSERPGLELATKSPLERMKATENVRVFHPRAKDILDHIQKCHEVSKFSAEPRCLFVKGRSGVGKSTLVEEYSAGFPRSRSPSGSAIVPVVGTRVPAPATVKSLVTRILRSLGDPAADRGTTDSRTNRLHDMMEKCQVELLLLDEFQHIIDPKRQAILGDVSDWLKSLIEETRVPVVLIGLPRSGLILDADEQLNNRFTARETLPPFEWDTADARDYFAGFLDWVDGFLPFTRLSGLGTDDLAIRFFYASGGILRPVMKLVRTAAHTAVERELPCLDLNVLAEAFNELFVGNESVFHNPFAVEVSILDESFQSAVEEARNREDLEEGDPEAVKRGVRKKSVRARAGDVLRR